MLCGQAREDRSFARDAVPHSSMSTPTLLDGRVLTITATQASKLLQTVLCAFCMCILMHLPHCGLILHATSSEQPVGRLNIAKL
jgi:hypothetical protein